MSSLMIEISPEVEKRLNSWSRKKNAPREILVEETLQKALEDWEDYEETLRISAEVKAGRMETYPKEEVWSELDELED